MYFYLHKIASNDLTHLSIHIHIVLSQCPTVYGNLEGAPNYIGVPNKNGCRSRTVHAHNRCANHILHKNMSLIVFTTKCMPSYTTGYILLKLQYFVATENTHLFHIRLTLAVGQAPQNVPIGTYTLFVLLNFWLQLSTTVIILFVFFSLF